MQGNGWVRYGGWIALAAAAAAYYPRFIKDPTGMTLYPQAADCVLHHEPLTTCALAFTYPPSFAFLIIPVVPLPMWGRNLVWYLLTLGATAVVWRCSELLVKRLYPGGWSERDLALLRVGMAILSLKFILAVFENQAYDLLALALILVGLVSVANKRANAGAGWLAFAAAIKATPLIFLPWLIIKRHYVAAICFVSVFLFLSLLPDLYFAPKTQPHGYFSTWLHEVAGNSLRNDTAHSKFAFWAGANQLNHSLRGAVARLIDEGSHPAYFKLTLYSTWLIFVGLLGILLAKSPSRAEFAGVDGSLLLIGMLLLSPMTSRSHYALLFLPYTMILATAVQQPASRKILWPILAVSFILCTGTSNDLVGERITGWAYLYGSMPAGAIVLMLGLGAIVLCFGKDGHVQFASATLLAAPLQFVHSQRVRDAIYLTANIIGVVAVVLVLWWFGYLPTGD